MTWLLAGVAVIIITYVILAIIDGVPPDEDRYWKGRGK